MNRNYNIAPFHDHSKIDEIYKPVDDLREKAFGVDQVKNQMNLLNEILALVEFDKNSNADFSKISVKGSYLLDFIKEHPKKYNNNLVFKACQAIVQIDLSRLYNGNIDGIDDYVYDEYSKKSELKYNDFPDDIDIIYLVILFVDMYEGENLEWLEERCGIRETKKICDERYEKECQSIF